LLQCVCVCARSHINDWKWLRHSVCQKHWCHAEFSVTVCVCWRVCAHVCVCVCVGASGSFTAGWLIVIYYFNDSVFNQAVGEEGSRRWHPEAQTPPQIPADKSQVQFSRCGVGLIWALVWGFSSPRRWGWYKCQQMTFYEVIYSVRRADTVPACPRLLSPKKKI
jgi:hypothetical protein